MSNFIQPVVLVILRKDDKILLTLRTEPDPQPNDFHGYWQIPGGGLEFGESLEECCAREAKEELGIDVKVVRLVPQIRHNVRGRWHGLLISFYCEMQDPTAQIILNEESGDYGWYTIEEAKKLKLTPMCIEIIEDVYRYE